MVCVAMRKFVFPHRQRGWSFARANLKHLFYKRFHGSQVPLLLTV